MKVELTGYERDLIVRALTLQIRRNNKAAELVSHYEVCEMIKEKNEELNNLIKKLAL